MRALFIGSNPSSAASGISAFSLDTKSGRTLHEWAEKAGVTIVDVENVARYPTPKNRPLNRDEIMQSLGRLNIVLQQYSGIPIIAVGKTAVKALTLLHHEFYEMPHPSGLNRQLNDPKFLGEKLKGLKFYLEAFK